jgi:hypothetical protein
MRNDSNFSRLVFIDNPKKTENKFKKKRKMINNEDY